MPQLDLRTKILPSDHKVFMLRPGAHYRFLQEFTENNAVFLDHPGLTIPEDIEDDDVLKKHVGLSDALRKWHHSNDEDKKEPSRNLKDYTYTSKTLTRAAHMGNIRGLYGDAQVGDVVVIPVKNYQTPILIGEIASKTVKYVKRPKEYGDEKLPGLPVKWLSRFKPKRLFSSELIDLLHHQKTLIGIHQEHLRREILNEIYQTYIYDGHATTAFDAKRDSSDFSELVPTVEFFMYLAAAYNAIEEDELEEFLSFDVRTATERYYERDYIEKFGVELHSPGYFSFITRAATLPLFVSAVMAASAKDLNPNEAANLEIYNSMTKAKNDDCTIDVQEKYDAFMRSLNVDQYNQICKMNKENLDGLGVESNAQISQGK